MVVLLMVFYLTLLNVADKFVGFVSEPIADKRIFRSSSNSARLRILCLPVVLYPARIGFATPDGSLLAFIICQT